MKRCRIIFITVVKKTFRLREVFLLQTLMPPSYYAEHIYDKRYNTGRCDQPTCTFNSVGLLVAITLMSLVIGCAAMPVSSSFDPRSMNEIRFRERSQSRYDDEVRVTVAVPTADENKALFSANLSLKEIQPVWVKVENHSDRTYYLISAAVDPNYFSPLETAYAVHGGLDQSARNEMEKYYRSMNFRNPILPDTAISGFIFTNLDEGEKIVQVTLIAAERVKFFTFFLEIPGMRVDYKMVDFDRLYPKEDIVELSEDRLWATLEKLPCCTTNEEGTAPGDPINLVVIGDLKDIAAAFARRGWMPAEETYSTAVWKTIKSFLFGSRYRYSPVSPLYFFGRHQDFARQKPRHDIHERNHLRLWYSPFRYRSKPVFVGQISRDIGFRLPRKRGRRSPTRSIRTSMKRVMRWLRTSYFRRCLPKSAG